MIIIGLTGSIGMGKTTTAKLFASEGIPVQDADEVVHQLYEKAAVPLIEKAFPTVIIDGKVDRQALGKIVVGDKAALKKLENIVHPLVANERKKFITIQKKNNEPFALLDIPLLFETGLDKDCDVIIVVTTSEEIQRERVLSRPNMTAEKFEKILATQMPDSEKRKKANFIVDTSHSQDDAKSQVLEIIKILSERAES